jgi:hypothetical protein
MEGYGNGTDPVPSVWRMRPCEALGSESIEEMSEALAADVESRAKLGS